MKVKELKQLLAEGCEGMTDEEFDDLDVLMPLTDTFDGYWKHPCPAETGVAQLGLDEDDETKQEAAFCIVSHGFFEEEHGVPVELN